MIKTELLAPARDCECGRAAIDYGADALYVGGPVFGARRAAANSTNDIARLVGYARQYGVRVYAALNTIVFEHELAEAERAARELIAAGVDALIVQDMAFRRMGLSGVELHASTQTSNTTPESVRFLGECGFSRVILERGLTLGEIKAIRAATDVELECFVHGAICVCTSGKCYLSRSMGSRSGNRGECSQPCRLTYDLLDSDGDILLKSRHLLSVMDLDLSKYMGELLDAGVTSFKIEGRLKDAAYVKNVVAFYRQALDRELAARAGYVRSSAGTTLYDFEPDPSKSFTRGASGYFLHGKRPGVASFDTPKSAGTVIGKVTETGKDWFMLDRGTLVAGDGIAFFVDGELSGTRINKVEGRKIFPNDMEGIKPGLEIRRNYDHTFSVALEKSRAVRKIDVTGRVKVMPDRLIFEITDENGFEASAMAYGQFDSATDTARMQDMLRWQLAKSGDTVFRITTIEVVEDGAMPFVPVSVLNGLRRDALTQLMESRLAARPLPVTQPENESYPYPAGKLGGDANVVNSIAAQFYRSHGVDEIEPGHDLLEGMKGRRVMTTPYCIRRETGRCIKENEDGNGALYMVRGAKRYRLEFDCVRCVMEIFEE